MSENTIPEKIQEVVSDVEQKVDNAVELAEEKFEKLADKVEELYEKAKDAVEDVIDEVSDKAEDVSDKVEDLADKSLEELSELFDKIKSGADRMSRSKEVESIKSAFYKLLTKLKGDDAESESSRNNPFDAVEQNFKAMYADYKKERLEFNKAQEQQREENLAKKQAIIEELKALVEGADDVSAQFPAFRELQNRWREAGPVPAKSYRDINDLYQFYVEKFYDMVKINRDLRDLDFKKNLEAKLAFCEAAEKLAENENVVSAFYELQKLHEQWKEFGPVAKEKRDDIWNRFKAATAVINKRYQAHFEGIKDQQKENLVKKEALCQKVEEIVAKEIKNSSEWNVFSKEIEDIQAEWRKIGYATKKENQKIYDRFRAACDAFYARKRDFYSSIKGSINESIEKKMALIEQAEALKDSKDWKKTTDQFISLQKQWKEIGGIPRKKSEKLWTRFRAACDEFFAARDAASLAENDYFANLKAKKKLIEEILAYEVSDNEAENADMYRQFSDHWASIGHVPFKEKDNINGAYKEAMNKKFPLLTQPQRAGRNAAPKSAKAVLINKYNALQQDITTYENNIGFFAASKNSAPLIAQMQQKIEEAKAQLLELEAQIRKAEEDEQ